MFTWLPRGELLLGLLVWAAVSDGLDGWVARRFGWQTALGAAWDLTADGIYFLGALLALWRMDKLPTVVGILVVVAALPEVAAQLISWHRKGSLGSFGHPMNKLLGAYSYAFVIIVALETMVAPSSVGQVTLALVSNGRDLQQAIRS